MNLAFFGIFFSYFGIFLTRKPGNPGGGPAHSNPTENNVASRFQISDRGVVCHQGLTRKKVDRSGARVHYFTDPDDSELLKK